MWSSIVAHSPRYKTSLESTGNNNNNNNNNSSSSNNNNNNNNNNNSNNNNNNNNNSSQAFKKYISDMTFFPRTAEFRRFFCHSQISLICLIHLSLPNLCFYTIRFITVFLNCLNKVNFKVLTQTYRIYPNLVLTECQIISGSNYQVHTSLEA